MCLKPLKYNFVTFVYTETKQVTIDPLCNGITVFNGGTTMVVFQGDPLSPGASKTIGGNYSEILSGRCDISFTGAGNNNAVVTQKFYLPGQGLEQLLG